MLVFLYVHEIVAEKRIQQCFAMNTKTVGYVAISNTINMWQVLNIKRDTSQNFKKPGFAIAAERIAVLARRKLLMN